MKSDIKERLKTLDNKMVQISEKNLRIFKIIKILLLSITIISLTVSYLIYTNKLTRKESIEKLKDVTNKDAYQFARFIAAVGTGLGVGARILGIYATAQESFIHCLIYGSTLVVLFLCYIIGVIRMSLFDAFLHIILVILAFIYAKIVSREEPFSKEVATLPL